MRRMFFRFNDSTFQRITWRSQKSATANQSSTTLDAHAGIQ
jgi:hypothetical protein